MRTKQYKLDIKFGKVFFKLKKLIVPYLINEYSQETIYIAFDKACDYFYKLCDELDRKGDKKDEEI